MNQQYTDCVEQISQILFQAITEREENLVETVEGLDSDLLSLLHTIGLRVMSMLMTWLVNQVTSQTQTIGWVIHRRPKIKYFVARMGKYPQLVQQLVGAAYIRGLAPQSQIFALADGAKGLKEALEEGFPKLQFILDRPHLKQHLYEGVKSLRSNSEL